MILHTVTISFILDVSLMSGLSKVYNVDVQAPNYDYSGSHRQSVVYINAKTGLQENEVSNLIIKFKIWYLVSYLII